MRGLAAAALLLGLALGCDDPPPCPEETFEANVVGSCTSAPTRVTVSTASCNLLITDGAGTAGLPAQGELDQAADPPRQGGWQIFGPICPPGQVKCKNPTEFRRCFATRVQFRLELECLDGSGAPVCKAEITE